MSTWPTSKGGFLTGEARKSAPGPRIGGYLSIERRGGAARAPSPGGLARRRWMITATKFMLPATAVLLLASIALWPEFERTADKARIAMTSFSASVDGARVTGANYHGVDDHNRPFTVTAATAIQRGENRIDLTVPNADITLENGSWLNVRSKQGVYARKDGQLDLSRDVVLYRDDGTTMTTASATVDTKSGAATSTQTTHVEGPFGTLDAEGFTTIDKGAAIQFWGPARVELNGVTR